MYTPVRVLVWEKDICPPPFQLGKAEALIKNSQAICVLPEGRWRSLMPLPHLTILFYEFVHWFTFCVFISCLLVLPLPPVNVQGAQHSQPVWKADSGAVWIYCHNCPIFIVMVHPFSPVFLVQRTNIKLLKL